MSRESKKTKKFLKVEAAFEPRMSERKDPVHLPGFLASKFILLF